MFFFQVPSSLFFGCFFLVKVERPKATNLAVRMIQSFYTSRRFEVDCHSAITPLREATIYLNVTYETCVVFFRCVASPEDLQWGSCEPIAGATPPPTVANEGVYRGFPSWWSPASQTYPPETNSSRLKSYRNPFKKVHRTQPLVVKGFRC